MAALSDIQSKLKRLRARRKDCLAQVAQLHHGASSRQDARDLSGVQAQIQPLLKKAAQLRKQERRAQDEELAPQQRLEELDAELPILLVPLRIQTRFADAKDGRELLVRVYPDDFSVQTHDGLLADAERAAGLAYWTAPEVKPDDPTLSRIEIWRGMFSTYGAARASYIRQATDPDKPAAPTTTRQAAVWTLPDRLVFRCMGDQNLQLGQDFVGKPIPDGLEAGFDPTQDSGGFTRPQPNDGDFEVPPELAWQYDFDAAVAVGMACRIPLKDIGNPRRINRLIVLGVRLSSDAKASAELLQQLVDDHRFTDGFEFVAQGTPTNVTQEGEPRAALGADEVDQLLGGSGAFEMPAAKTLYESEPDGLRLARALGLDSSTFARVPFAGLKDGAEAIAMKRALWSGTLGYHAQQMLAPLFEALGPRLGGGAATERLLLTAKFFFTNFVFGRGPLPAIRVGQQPYGIVPVSADMLGPMTPGLASWRENYLDAFMTALHAKLQVLVPAWRQAQPTVATVASGRIAEVLSLQASSVEYHASRFVGTEYLRRYVDFKKGTAETELNRFIALLDERWKNFDAQFAGLFGTQPRVFNLSHFGGLWRSVVEGVSNFDPSFSPPLTGDVIDNLPLSESRQIDSGYPNYIASFSGLDFDAIRRGLTRADGQPLTALLYMMLRHSILYEHAFTAMRLVHRANGTPWGAFREKESFNLAFALEPTYWDLLQQPIDLPPVRGVEPTPLGFIKRRKDVRAALPWAADYLDDIDDLQHALKLMATLPTARLERLFAEHIDLCGYRIDAWITGFVYQRLLGHRMLANPQALHPLRSTGADEVPLRYNLNLRPLAGASRGLYLGAYGYVESLQADEPGVPVTDLPADLRPKNGGVVTRDEDNAGFIHAPSLNQAVTAAILRSGSITEPDTTAFNINLSSARTRDALWMIDGIRNGQLPAALLGCRFERGLRDARKDLQHLLPALRQAFAMPRPPQTLPEDPTESIPANNVVNGLTLVQARREGRLEAELAKLNPRLNGDEPRVINALVDQGADLLDACADLMLAESVHQAAQGNFARAGAAVTAAGEFTHVPERFDVVTTPRSGTTVTHRLLLAFDPAARSGGPDTPRARLAPAVDAWLAKALGPLSQWRCAIAYRSEGRSSANFDMALQADTAPVLASFDFSLSDLGLPAIDILYLLDDGQGTELAQRADLLAPPHIRAALQDVESVRIELQLFAPVPAGQRPVGELMPLATQLRHLLLQARPATRRDFLAPKMLHAQAGSRSTLESIDGEALRFAVLGTHEGDALVNPDSLMLAAQAAADALALVGPDTAEADIEALLLRASNFGLPDSLPALMSSNSRRDRLVDKALRAQAALRSRIDAAIGQSKPEALKADLLAACSEVAKTLLGSSLPLLPGLLMTDDLAGAVMPVGAPDPQRIEDWLFAASLVRPGAQRLQHARVAAAAADTALEDLRVLQWPAASTPWIAEPRPDGAQWDDDRVAIAVQPAMALDFTQPLVALVIDEWTEMLPNDKETTGVAFHYDAPNAEPPQALLLAVSARPLANNGRWRWEELVGCVEQAFELARLRTVGPDELRKGPLDTVLPATMMAESAAPVTVATSLFANASAALAVNQAKLWNRT